MLLEGRRGNKLKEKKDIGRVGKRECAEGWWKSEALENVAIVAQSAGNFWK